MLFGTLIIEGVGAILLAIRFVPMFGVGQGIWYGIFHSISAFCNAGFDLMGQKSPGSSLTLVADDPVILTTIMVLITTGGIGFIVWSDICDNRLNFKKYALHTKIMVTFTIGLILFGAVLFLMLENNAVLAGMTPGEKVLNAFFASVTPRTAGFNSIDYMDMTRAGRMLTMFLMAIGAGTGSTGGGLKVTTFVTLILALYSQAKSYNDLSIFRRRLQKNARRDAMSSLSSYMALIIVCVFLLLIANPSVTLESCTFEAISALSTVGLTMGISGSAGAFSKICLMVLMYCGRLGSIAVAMAFVRRKVIPDLSYPEESITIG